MNLKTLDWIRDVMICLGIFFLGYITPKPLFLEKVVDNTETISTFKDIFDSTTVVSYLKKHQVKFSHIVLAQAKLESGILNNSKLAKKYNNILGLRVPARRYTFCTNSYDYGNFAEFLSVEDCIKDYKSWQIQNAFFITTEEEYFSLLETVYCKDPGYIQAIKKLIK